MSSIAMNLQVTREAQQSLKLSHACIQGSFAAGDLATPWYPTSKRNSNPEVGNKGD